MSINRDPELVEDEIDEVELIQEVELPDYDHSDFELPEDFEPEDDD